MKEKMQKHNVKETAAWIIGLFVFSVLVFALILGSNRDVFSADDNGMQWAPVIRTAFDSIFSGNGIPYWNFYQYKGIDIFSAGYYGLTNPFMYISYMISRFVFQKSIDVLAIYIWLLYWLGLCFMYLLLRDMKIQRPTIAISLLAYGTVLFFFLYSFYYFEFNCFLMVPLLAWAMLKTHNTKMEWFVPGILLAFGLLLGHVQYACFFAMVYCIIMVVWAVAEKKGATVLRIGSNLSIFLLLSVCLLILSLRISPNRSAILSVGNDAADDFFLFNFTEDGFFNVLSLIFLSKYKVSRFHYQDNLGLGIFSFLPFILLMPAYANLFQLFLRAYRRHDSKRRKINHSLIHAVLLFLTVFLWGVRIMFFLDYVYLSEYLSTPIRMLLFVPTSLVISLLFTAGYWFRKHSFAFSEKTCSNLFCLTMLALSLLLMPTLVYLLAVLYFVITSVYTPLKVDRTPAQKWTSAVFFAAGFFLVFSLGEKNGIAFVLSKIPVFKEFRHLYKCAFVFSPLFIISGAYALDTLKKNKKWIYGVSICLSALYVVNLIGLFYGARHQYMNHEYYLLNQRSTIEPEIMARIKDLDVDTNYRYITIGDEEHYLEGHKLTATVEFSSHICVVGLTKNYATAYGLYSINGYDNVFSSKGFASTNHIMKRIYVEGMFDNMISIPSEYTDELFEDEEYISTFEKQWIDAGIRYVLTPKNSPSADHWLTIFEHCQELRIVERKPWYDDYDIVVVDGAKPICSFGESEKLTFESDIDALSFQTDFTAPTEVFISMICDPGYRLSLKNNETGQTTYAEIRESDLGYVVATIPAGSYTAKLSYTNTLMDMTCIVSLLTTLLSLASIAYICCKTKKCPEVQVDG